MALDGVEHPVPLHYPASGEETVGCADVGPLVAQARARSGGARVIGAADLDRVAMPKRRRWWRISP